MSHDELSVSAFESGNEMAVNGLYTTLNMPPALEQRFDGAGNERALPLPPYNPRAAFVVDEYLACPKNWMHSAPGEASYFVPVLSEHGLWLDFNKNVRHSHYVSVAISVQGVNAITGEKTNGFGLEQYREMCPKHKAQFGHERFCEACGYQWDAQNYMSSNAQPRGFFWIDGFRAKDGVVRQFVFTEEEMRGIAKQLIGADRVFAIGIAFYLSKLPKPVSPVVHLRALGSMESDEMDMVFEESGCLGALLSDEISAEASCLSLECDEVMLSDDEEGEVNVGRGDEHPLAFDGLSSARSKPSAKKLEIGAGAKIDQKIHMDNESLDFWQEKPAGIIYINYTNEESARKIIASGRRDLTAQGEGFMKNLVVGHPKK